MDKPDLSRLAMSEEEVQSLAKEQRLVRLGELINEAQQLVEWGVEHMVHSDGRRVAAMAILYSGGNDSTCLAHLFRDRADFALHANTTIGIEETRQFVRDTCRDWGLELREYFPDKGCTYAELVIQHGFPGPALHYKMYQRLKERALRTARRDVVKHPYKERIVFLAGRRRTESSRRANVPEFERFGSTVWIAPMVNWTKTDLYTYREWAGDVPRNRVSDLIHMSGECLCGAFAHKDELAEIEMFFPNVAQEIRQLENMVRLAGHPDHKCKWGWGATERTKGSIPLSGPMCSSCEYRAGAAMSD